MPEQFDTSRELIRKAAEKYSEQTSLRAAVQMIPHIGGILDTLVSGGGQKIQQRRIYSLLDELNLRLSQIETPKQIISSEDLFDLMIDGFERAAKARSDEKRRKFANIIARGIEQAEKIEDASTALRLTGELDEVQIQILHIALNAPIQSGSFQGLKVITLSVPLPGSSPDLGNCPILTTQLPDTPLPILRHACAELVSKGLIHDETIGRFGSRSMEYFVGTDLADWLYRWIKN